MTQYLLDWNPVGGSRGQVGIGTLIVFIAMVLVASIAAAVLINTAGILHADSSQAGQHASAQVTDRLDIVSTVGQVNGDGAVYAVNVAVQPAPGAGEIDLRNVTVAWVGPGGEATLVHAALIADPANTTTAHFETAVVKDADGSAPVMNAPDDRVEIRIDLTHAANPGVLTGSDTATLTVVTKSGGRVERRLEIPPGLSGRDKAVVL